MKTYSIGNFAKEIGVTVQTLRNWDKADRLKPNHTAPSGHRYYSEDQLNNYLNGEVFDKNEVAEKIELESERAKNDFIQVAQIMVKRMKKKDAEKILRLIREL